MLHFRVSEKTLLKFLLTTLHKPKSSTRGIPAMRVGCGFGLEMRVEESRLAVFLFEELNTLKCFIKAEYNF